MSSAPHVPSVRRLALELAAFSATAAFAAFHWGALLADPPDGRIAACIGIATFVGALLALSGRLRWPWPLLLAARLALALAALVVGMRLLGLPGEYLAPARWGEFADGLAIGLEGSSQIDLPYAGGDAWTRLALLLAIPAALIPAAALAFWPARSRGRLRIAALIVLVGLYAVAVTWDAPSAEVARGIPLLLLIAAWIWLPVLPARSALPAGLAVLVAGLVAVPLASRVQAADPIIDYKDWAIFGNQPDVEFDWNHSYGPLDWPQRGTVVLELRSPRPLYWKTATIDVFDGTRWQDAPALAIEQSPRIPSDELAGAPAEMIENNARWQDDFRVNIRGLASDVLVTAGTTVSVEGVETTDSLPNGESVPTALPLRRGDAYTVTAYVPDPSEAELRASPGRYPRELERYVSFLLPQEGFSTDPPSATARIGDFSSEAAQHMREQLDGTPLEEVHELALRLTEDAVSPFDAVEAIEEHLEENYTYSQNVPEHEHPIPAFLFEDRAGYCQHFAGAMALMLRMVGIPARVVSGFAPGVQDEEEPTRFTVRDLDAHSWVEVWFNGIGWVTFDPTPSISPASVSENVFANRSAAPAAPDAPDNQSLSIEEAEREGALRDLPQAGGAGGGDGGSSPVGFLVVAGLGSAYGGVAFLRRRRMLSPAGPELQVRELARALERLGWEVPPGGTLLEIERRLRAQAGPSAARYVAALREHRYRATRPRPPGPEERSALRRALRRGAGPFGWWRALRALPPGGPALFG